MDGDPAAGSGRLDRARSRLSENYRRGLRPKIHALCAAGEALAAGDAEAAAGIRRLAHQLRGSGSSFGFPEITAAATRVEDAAEPELRSALDDLLRILRATAEREESEEPARILIVEDDDDIDRQLRSALAGSGRVIERVTTVAEAEARLTAAPPDLAILDLTLPDGDGRSLLARLQDRTHTAGVPIVVLSARTGAGTKAECLALGAEQYFEKPIEAEFFSAAVAGIIDRSRRHADEVRIDSLTGLANRAGLREAFDRARKLSQRVGLPLSLAMLDLDHFKALNDTLGHTFGDEVLRRMGRILKSCLRESDVSARWGGEEFVVLLQDCEAKVALGVLGKLQEALRGMWFATESGECPVVTVSGGVVDVAPDDTLDAALDNADKLLYVAKRRGRDRILDAVPDEALRAAARILLAEDDPDTALLVSECLADAGFEVSHYADGSSAIAAALAGTHDLAILDKVMPGADGFEVLRRLRAEPRYRSTPILVLTAVGCEEEIERAFNLGADDYVQKPFKTRELTARVRRLLRH